MRPGDRIHAARLEAGLSLRELALRAVVAHSDLSAVEHGHREAWPAMRARLADALGVPEEVLFAPTTDETDDLLAAVDALSSVVAASADE